MLLQDSRLSAISLSGILSWPVWGGLVQMWSASKLLQCVSLRWQRLDLVNETGSFNFSLNWNHHEDRRNQRDFPVLLSASRIMCFRNPFLGRGLPITLKMQEGHAQSNLTFRMGEVSLTQDTWEVSWGLSAKVILSDVKPSFSLFNTHTHPLTSLLFSWGWKIP